MLEEEESFGGVKILKNDENLINEVKKMFGKR